MRKGWEYKKLGEYVKEYSVKNKLNENIPVYSVTNSQGFCKDYFGKEVASKDKSTYKIVPFGFFAYNPSRINVGSIDWQAQEDRVIVSPLYNVFSVSAKLKQQYLLYYLKSPLTIHYIDSVATGTVRLNLKFSMLKEFIVPIPSIAKQEYIVSELDKINELIRLKKEQLKDFDNLAQSLFYDMFGDPMENEKGWEVKKLGEVGELARGVSKHRPRNAPELLGGSMPLIQTGDVANSDFYITKYSSTYSKLGVEQSRVWEAGTLCITIAATIGKCAILGFTACFPDSVVGYKPNNDANAIYMYFIFKNMQKMLEEFAPGVAQKNINLKILSNLSIPLPPLPLQRLFAQRIEQIEREKSEVQKSIQDLETLLASRMQYWFE